MHTLASPTTHSSAEPAARAVRGRCPRPQPGRLRQDQERRRPRHPRQPVRALSPLPITPVTHTPAPRPATSDAIQIDSQTQIQVLDTMADLADADKEQMGAFVRDERVLVAWSDHIDGIVPLCKDFEQKLIARVWRSRPAVRSLASSATVPGSSSASTVSGSVVGLNEKAPAFDEEEEKEETTPPLTARDMPKPRSKWSFFGGSSAAAAADPEKGTSSSQRPMRLFAPAYGGIAAALSMCTFIHSYYVFLSADHITTVYIGSGVNMLLTEIVLDGDYTRLALLVTAPFLFCVSIVSRPLSCDSYNCSNNYP